MDDDRLIELTEDLHPELRPQLGDHELSWLKEIIASFYTGN